MSTWHYILVVLIESLGVLVFALHELHGELMVLWNPIFGSDFAERFDLGLVSGFVSTLLLVRAVSLACRIYFGFLSSPG